MKKLFFLLFAIILSVSAYSQLEVKPGSFREVTGFVNTNPDPNYQYDDNDKPFAVVKVRTENISDKQRKELQFEGNGGTFIMLEYKVGEVWVYMTAKYADYLKISHPEFSSIEYTLPEDLKAKHGYEITLVNKTSHASGFGVLTVTTKPEDGAKISLNGRPSKTPTPYYNDMIPAGQYEITVVKDRYKPATKIVDIAENETKTLDIDMLLDVATVTVNADNMTDVYVDGTLKQKGTWSGELKSGEHEITLARERYKTTMQTITVEGGKDQTVNVVMPIDVAVITLTSDEQTDVYVDSVFMKRGTWSGELYSGDHVVEYRKQYHRPETKTISVVAGQPATYELHPSPIYGTVTVTSDPAGAKVLIDGTEYGVTPIVINEILTGPHELKLEKEKRKTLKKIIALSESGLNLNEKLDGCPVGAISGVFSTSDTTKVYFSQGNLAFDASTKTWYFAENQLSRGGKNYSDLFEWGTSGYKGIYPGKELHSYEYGDNQNDIANTNYDWGVYNTISNGGSEKWFTLSRDEWEYIVKYRKTNSGIRWAQATVDNKKGLILLPDNWDSTIYVLNKTNDLRPTYKDNIISLFDWTYLLEANGAVFLMDEYAHYYWTSSVCKVQSYTMSLEDAKKAYKKKQTKAEGEMALIEHGRAWAFNVDVWVENFTHEESRGIKYFVRLVCPAE